MAERSYDVIIEHKWHMSMLAPSLVGSISRSMQNSLLRLLLSTLGMMPSTYVTLARPPARYVVFPMRLEPSAVRPRYFKPEASQASCP